MGRVLAISERQVPVSGQADYRSTLAARRNAAKQLGIAFWVFAHTSDSERFIEFSEGADEASVARATDYEPAPSVWRELGVD